MSQVTINNTNIIINDEEMFSLPVASILVWLTDDLPTTNYLWCDGEPYDSNKYPDLYNAMGTTYGVNNDINDDMYGEPLLPNLCGRTPIGSTIDHTVNAINDRISLQYKPNVEDASKRTGGNTVLYPNQLLHTHSVSSGNDEYITSIQNSSNADYDNDNDNWYEVGGKHESNRRLKPTYNVLSNHLPPHSKVNFIIFAGKEVS